MKPISFVSLMARKLLIIAPTFYPDPMVASVRMTQWCRHLPEFGWEPVVATRHGGYEATREQLGSFVHPDARVMYLNPALGGDRVRRNEATMSRKRSLRQRLKGVAAQFFVPDQMTLYWRRVLPRLLEIAREVRPDAVLTTSPPHSVHTVGARVAEAAGAPWVADYRDPHIIDRRFRPVGAGRMLFPLHIAAEKHVYSKASLVVHAIPFQQRFARRRYPSRADDMVVIENGVPVELTGLISDPDVAPDGVKSVRVIGSIDPPETDMLVEAVEKVNALGVPMELRLIGAVPADVEVLRTRLGEKLVTPGYLRHDQAIRQVAGADILVSFLGAERSKNLQLTSKHFEFLASGKPLVVINPTLPDRTLLHGMPGVFVLRRPSLEQIVSALCEALRHPSRPVEAVEAFRHQYSRRQQVATLAARLDQLVG